MKKRTKSFLAILLAVVMILSSAGVVYAAPDETSQPGSEESAEDEQAQPDAEDPADEDGEELEMEDLDASSLGIHKLGEEEEEAGEFSPEPDTSLDQTVRVSIFLKTPATLGAGYQPAGVGTNAGAISYRNALKANQSQMTAVIESAVGYSINVQWNLTLLVNAISGYVKLKDIPIIERLDGVAAVQRETRYTVPVEGSGSQPNTTHTSTGMVGASDAWAAGYTGAGMRIAIIDTGIDTTHQSFDSDALSYALGTLKKAPTLMSEADVAAVASQLNGSGSYVSTKIPYGYNYVDRNLTIDHMSDKAGEHGSHVAGIAAANRYINNGSGYTDAATSVYALGMAPDAQLLVMKVFGQGGGAYDSDYMAAIEDSIVLGCDSCNLSLGSAAPGYTYISSSYYQDILNNLSSQQSNYGMVVTISAGNNSSLAANLGTDLYIDDVAMHTGGSPGTYINSLSTASSENIGMSGTPLIYNGRNIYYMESASSGAPMMSIPGTWDYVYIDAIGEAVDYSTVDPEISLSGKIVIVNRGGINFSDKGNNAISYAPKAVVVANNQPGTISMQLSDYTGSFPMVLITLDDAEMIKAGAEEKTVGDYTCYTGSIVVSAQGASDVYTTRDQVGMSSFSSWGVPGSLIMKPEITAPGSNIYSVFGTNVNKDGIVTGGSNRYELMGGTSMAAPHIAGLSAIVAQYLEDQEISVPGYSRRALIQSLLMSTATPMKNGGAYVSVLQQGSGLVDASKAISSGSAIFMTSAGLTSATGAAADGKVKVELGDDPAKSGGYSYAFRIYNLTDETLSFESPRTDIFTQGYYTDGGDVYMAGSTVSAGGQIGYTWSPSAAQFNPYDVNQDGSTTDQDAQTILDLAAGNISEADVDLTAADFDEDGSVTSYDAHQLLEYLNQDQATGCIIPAKGYADVTVSFSFGVDSSIYTAGAYIEGFTYVTEKARKDGVAGVQHAIPILGYFGSWTEPSMFDNTSYMDLLYGTEKIPYSGTYKTNYMTTYYSGVGSVFTGNPYMVEDEFPADRLAVNSTNDIGKFYYNLLRSAGTEGFAVSKLDSVGGNVIDVVLPFLADAIVTGLWYDADEDTWNNTGAKSFTVNMSPADFGLAEGDVFRTGFYALPEYYGMLTNSDLTDPYAGVISEEAFDLLLKSGVLGSGAYVGYDFTIDDTEPEILSASLRGNELTVMVSDNQNLAYVALLTLDGEIVYAEEAPGKDEFIFTFDAGEAIEEAKGYVALFAADYAGNETAKALKVNDNVEAEETVYVLTDTLEPGSNYLIVSANEAGSGYALGHEDASVTADDVTVNEGTDETDDAVYIRSADVDETSVWTVDGSYSFENNEYYLNSSGTNLTCTDVSKDWTAEADTLSTGNGNNRYYVTFANDAWTLARTAGNVYFYKEAAITSLIDPEAVTSVSLLPSNLDLYKGNTAELIVEVLPLTAGDRSVTWTTSDPSVAVVNENGMVTAVAAGSAVITATSNADDSISAECPVSVICVEKTFNNIIWDENGDVFFSSFNAASLPAWSRNHEDSKEEQLASAFMRDPNTLIATTMDSSTGETELFTVDRSSYEMTDYGANYVWATDVAVGAADSSFADYMGMAYTYAYLLVAGPVEPLDDGSGELWCGYPFAMLNCGNITGGTYFAGIAVKERTATGGIYYVLDENGDIWQTTLEYDFNTGDFAFSTPIKVMETGIATSFLYQNLYYDGTYLYWSHYADGYAILYVIDIENQLIYDAGDFGADVWPATGMYVDGSVAPAAAGSETMSGSVPANVDFSNVKVKATREELLTPEIQARFAAEAARVATKPVRTSEDPEEEPEEPVEEETEPEDPEEEPEDPADEETEPEEPGEDVPEETDAPEDGEDVPEETDAPEEGEDVPEETGTPEEAPVEPEAPEEDVPEETGVPEETAPEQETGSSDDTGETETETDPEYSGSINAVSDASAKRLPFRNAAAEVAQDEESESGAVQIRLYEETAVYNGLYTVSYDPAVLKYTGASSDTAYHAVCADPAEGTVTFAFAAPRSGAVEANNDIAVLSFEFTTSADATVTVGTKERNYLLSLTEEDELTLANTSAPSNITSNSISFDGKLYLNTYIALSEEAAADKDAYIQVTFNDETKEYRVSDLLKSVDSKGRVKVGQVVYAAMMRDEMKLQLLNGNGEAQPLTYKKDTDVTGGFTYKAVDYLKDRQVNSANAEMRELARAAELYGIAAQVKFGYKTDQLTADDIAKMKAEAEGISIPEARNEILDGTLPEGITKRTKTVLFNADNTLRMYFYLDDPGKYTFTIDGQKVTPKKAAEGKYYIEQRNIASGLLSERYEFGVSDGTDTFTSKCSVLSYAYSIQQNSSNADMVDLCKLLYLFSQAANAYFQ